MKKMHLKKLWNRALSLTLAFSMTASLCFVASLLPVAGAEEEEEGEPHHHTFACYEEYELDCREDHAEGEHRELCYTYSGELVCGFEEGELHVHNEQECEKVARVLVCEEKEDEEIRDEEILSDGEEAEETEEDKKNGEGSASDENEGGDGSGANTANPGAGSSGGSGAGTDENESSGDGSSTGGNEANGSGSGGGNESDGSGSSTGGNEANGSGSGGGNESDGSGSSTGGNESDGSGSSTGGNEADGNGSSTDGNEANGSGSGGGNEAGGNGSGTNGNEADGNGTGTGGNESSGSGTGTVQNGTDGSESSGNGADGSGSNGNEAGGSYASFTANEITESYGFFRKMEVGRPYLMNSAVTSEAQAAGPESAYDTQSDDTQSDAVQSDDVPSDDEQQEAGSEEEGGSDSNLPEEEKTEESNREDTEEGKPEGEDSETESEGENKGSITENKTNDHATSEEQAPEESSEAETQGEPETEEKNPQESSAEETQESSSEGETETEETSAAETEGQVHEHTRECYADIYKCRRNIRQMVLPGTRVSDEAGLLEAIDQAEAGQETEIQITGNFEIAQTVEIDSGKNIIIELDGYTLTYHGAGDSLFTVNAGGKLKITDSNSEEQDVIITKSSAVSEPGEATYDPTTGELTYYVTEAQVNLDGKSTTNTTTEYVVDFGLDDVDVSGGEAGAIESANGIKSLILVNGGTLRIEGGRLTNSGGNHGVLIESGEATMTGGYLVGSGKTDPNGSENDGGGIQIKAGVLNIDGGVIANNKGFRGGAIYASGGTVTISKGLIAENNAMQGGAVLVQNKDTTANMKGGVISANKAAANGGGVYTLNAKLNISATAAILGNTAKEAGGGIRSYGSTNTITVTGGIIAGNEADGKTVAGFTGTPGFGNGGGIYASSGERPVSIENAVIAANKAKIQQEDPTKEQAGNGGGVYCEETTTKIGRNTVIAGNQAASGSGIYLLNTVNAENAITGNVIISNNQASENGGGIYSENSKITLAGNAAITGNQAEGEGGGIYNDSDPKQVIPIKDQSVIAANTANAVKSNSIHPCEYNGASAANSYTIDRTSYVEGIWNTTPAAEVKTVKELKARIEVASTNHFDATLIPLGDDIKIDSTDPVLINSGKNIILDLKGHNITADPATGNQLFSVDGSDSSLTVMDSESGEDPEPEKGSEESGDPEDAGKTGRYENDSLVYYVTESEPAGIYTEEARYPYTLNPRNRAENKPIGMIDGGGADSVISSGNGARVAVEGGIITNPNGRHGIRLASQSSLMIKGGYLVGCGDDSDGNKAGGGGVLSSESRIQMTGGVIAGNRTSGNGGGIRAEGKGEVRITGGVIAANEAGNQGGGLSVENANATINGDAVISGNLAKIQETPKIEADRGSAYLDRVYGGGGVFIDADAKLFIQEECYITNNRVERETVKNAKDGGGTGGGGVFACGAVNMSGGFVTANYSQASGGGIYSYSGRSNAGSGINLYTGNISLSGGTIAGNYARYNEGGGLRSDWRATVENSGSGKIYITNNVTETSENWGGGGIFNTSSGFMSIKNVLITENTAQGFGGGIAGCNHGTNRLFVENGGAIYNNTAKGGEDCPKLDGYETHSVSKRADKNNADRVDARTHVYSDGKDLGRFIDYADENGNGYYQDFYCANVSQVNDHMLGGGSAGWRGSSSDNDKGEVNPVARAIAVEKDGYAESRNMMGLTAYPDQTPSEAAAEIYITGNRSAAHGGGVMTNGTFQVGSTEADAPEAGTLEIEKRVRDVDGKKLSYDGSFQFKIQLKDENGEDLRDQNKNPCTYPAVKIPAYNGEDPNITIQNDSTFSLYADQSLKISGLPVVGYQVQEVLKEGEDNYIVEISNKKDKSSNKDESILWADEGKKVTFVNIPKQDFTISKVVLKNGAALPDDDLRAADEFEFTLTFTDGRGNAFTGEPYADKFSYEKHKHVGGKMIPDPDTSFAVQEGNRLKAKLHHNECIVIHDLPAGVKYKVEEEKATYPLGYIPDSEGNGDYQYDHEQQGSGSIQAGQDASVKFVNILSSNLGNLSISKKVQDASGNDILPADTQVFEFTVKLTDKDGKELPGRYAMFSYSNEESSTGNPGGNAATIASGETVRLHQDEEIIIQNLPLGTHYSVKETPIAGYTSKDGNYEKQGVIESAQELYYTEYFNIKNSEKPDVPEEPTRPEEPTSPTRNPSGGGGNGGGGGGSTDPTPPSPTDPAPEPPVQAATEPELPEQPQQPEYPSELPDPNNPDSPNTITILVNGVPTTYFKYWDPELKEYVYLLEDQIPLAYRLPDAGEDSQRLLWLTLCGISMAGMMMLLWGGRGKRIRKK